MKLINPYIPETAVVEDVKNLTQNTKLFTLKFQDINKQRKFGFTPGQFVEISVFGFGEVPIGISSDPENRKNFQIGVRETGSVTKAICRLDIGDTVGIRGPYGNGFPLKLLFGRNIVITTGGTGISPLRSLVYQLIRYRNKFKKIYFLYGAKTPNDLLFRGEFKLWEKYMNLCITVDQADPNWTGELGLVTKLCRRIDINPENSRVIMVGPTMMYKSMVDELSKLKINPENIYISLERRMKCGFGKCQHCTIGTKYVCKDGPIFRLDEIMKFPGAI